MLVVHVIVADVLLPVVAFTLLITGGGGPDVKLVKSGDVLS